MPSYAKRSDQSVVKIASAQQLARISAVVRFAQQTTAQIKGLRHTARTDGVERRGAETPGIQTSSSGVCGGSGGTEMCLALLPSADPVGRVRQGREATPD